MKTKILIGLGLISLLLLTGCMSQRECVDYYKQYDGINIECTLEPTRCIASCEDFGMKYYRYIPGGFGQDSCVCDDNGEPKNIY